jgi:AcrR family transcriptional regulator
MNEHSFMPVTTSAADPLTPPDPHGSKEAAILDAALDLFCERTFAGCAVPAVAERAGVATGTIYRYFPSKEALLNAVYQQWKGELRDRLLADHPAGEPRDEFHHWWSALSGFVREYPTAFAFLELHHHEPYVDQASRRLALEIDGAALQFTIDGQVAGVIRDDQSAPVLIALVYGALTGLFRARRLFPDVVPADSYDEAEVALWDMLTDQSTHDRHEATT